MHAIADICVIPLTGNVSVRNEVARAHQILRDAGLTVVLHAYGTNVEGELATILAAIGQVHESLHRDGAPRISTTIKLGTRTDKSQSLGDKIDAVNELLR